jgi:hypothetical protein
MFRSALAALLLTLTLAAPAETLAETPGTYTQYLCRLPSGNPAPTDGLLPYSSGSGSRTDVTCDSRGYINAWVSGDEPSTATAGFNYRVPPDTHVVGVEIDRGGFDMSTGTARYAFPTIGDSCDPGAFCGQFPRTWSGLTNEIVLSFGLDCPDSGCQAPSHSPHLRVASLIFELQDAFDPEVDPLAPTGLFDPSRPLSGVESSGFTVRDQGGGVYEVALLVDGEERLRQPVNPNDASCEKPFTRRAPCPGDATGHISFDTRKIPNGEHYMQLAVWDATETNKSTSSKVPVVVANSPDEPPAGSGGGGGGSASDGAEPAATGSGVGAVVGSSVGGSGPDRAPADERPVGAAASRAKAKFVTVDESAGRARTVRHGSAATLRGRLVDAAGRPVAGAKVDVLAAVRRPGEKAQKLGTVTTDRTGAVTYRLRPGASSDVTFAYRPEGAAVDEATLGTTLYVRAGVRLARSRTKLRNGERMTLTARVLGRFVGPGATKVSFQVQIGRAWRTFATAAVDRRGVARIRHRFRFTTMPVTYRFRAVTTRTARFPYLPGSSNVAAVKVRP